MSTVLAGGAPHRGTTRRRPTVGTRKALLILAFLAPALAFVSVFTYYPMLRGSQMAFRDWNLYDLTDTPWIGWDNFTTLLADPTFGVVLRNTLVWVVGSIVPQVILGFVVALCLWRRFPFRGVYQALVFYPWAVSGFLIGVLFRWMFNSEFGVINDLLTKAHLIDTPIPWLADPRWAMTAVILANVWYGVTFFAIMLLAALQSVPAELLEAAAVDGAGRLRTLVLVVLPYIRTTIVLTVLLRIIWIFNFPDLIYAMTGGGPAQQTHIITTWMIDYTQQGRYGLASSLGLVVVLVLTVFTGLYLAALGERGRR